MNYMEIDADDKRLIDEATAVLKKKLSISVHRSQGDGYIRVGVDNIIYLGQVDYELPL